MSLLDLPSTILVSLSTHYLSPSSLRSLHATNQRLCTLLTPVLHCLAAQPSFAPTALHYAVAHRNEPLIRHILSSANLHIHGTPLHGELLVPLLLDPDQTRRLVITDRSLHGTPLHWAARYGSATVTRTLLARGVGVDAAARNGATALGWAAYNGCPEVIRMLLDAGADSTLKDRAGLRPLHYALAKGKKEAVEMLKEARKKKGKRI